MFFIVILLLLFATSSFTGASLTHFTGEPAWIGQLISLAIPSLFVLVIILSHRGRHGLIQLAGKITSIAMGWLNFAFVAAVACWLFFGGARIAGFSLPQAKITWVLIGLSVAFTFYGLANAATLRVTRYTVRLPNLPLSWRGRRVALVTDIHLGTVLGPPFAQKIVTRLKELAPAAVFISGDMFDGAQIDLASAVAPWKNFLAPFGTFFVSGNHDEFRDRAPYLAALSAVGVHVLHNEKVIVDGLQIVGIHDGETHRPDLYRELLSRVQLERTQASILLAHHPSHLEIPAEAGISLQLSGHTHGGQFFPWILLVRLLYGKFGYGLNRFKSLQIVTSSGAGSGGPPMRVGTRSEIVLLQLENE